MTSSFPVVTSQPQAALFGEGDLLSATASETLAAESTTGTVDDDDDRDDEHDAENEAPVRETDEATEAPEEFEVDDDENLDEDEDEDLDGAGAEDLDGDDETTPTEDRV